MPPRTIAGSGFSSDIIEFIRALQDHRVRYVVVGGEAVIYHGYPRLTGDIDFFYDHTPANARRLMEALSEFWLGNVPGIRTADELLEPGIIIQFGRPPNRIDLMNQIDGVSFDLAWKSRIRVRLEVEPEPLLMNFIGRDALVLNKRASARAKDLDDVEHLE